MEIGQESDMDGFLFGKTSLASVHMILWMCIQKPRCGLRQRKCISGSWFTSIYTPLFSLSYVPQANGTQFTLSSQSTTVLGIEPISRPGQVMLWLQPATADWACCSHSGLQAAAGATVSKVADCPASSGGPCAGN